MGHLREVSDDEVTIDIFSDRERELGFMLSKGFVFEEFLDTDDITFLIRDFDPDEAEAWNRCLDTDTFGLEGESEVFLQVLDLRKAYSFSRSESVLDDRRTDAFSLHFDIEPELEQGLLDQDGFLFDLTRTDEILMRDRIEEVDSWEIPASEL